MDENSWRVLEITWRHQAGETDACAAGCTLSFLSLDYQIEFRSLVVWRQMPVAKIDRLRKMIIAFRKTEPNIMTFAKLCN